MNEPVDDVYVVIAAYNEGAAIADNVTRCLAVTRHVIVVDDCSGDDTGAVAYAAGATVLRHPVNLGQGAALQTGIGYARTKGAAYVVTFDADGQHDANEILPMVHALREKGVMVALGSRFLGRSVNLPSGRRLLLKAAIAFTRVTTGGSFSDVHNGFRVLSRAFIERFEFTQNRMAHASEIQSYIAQHRIPFIEFPVTISYTAYSLKKGQKGSNSFRILIELLLGRITQ